MEVTLIILGAALLLASRRQHGISGYGHQTFGGNSGYDGYSMSRRAREARAEGKYPKTDFRQFYKITRPSLDALVELGVICNSEWHHTSSWGNRTVFYEWASGEYKNIYSNNKAIIDKLARTGDYKNIADIFDVDYEKPIPYKPVIDDDYEAKLITETERRKNKVAELYPDGIYYYDGEYLHGYIDLQDWINNDKNILSCTYITNEDQKYNNTTNKWYIIEQFNKIYFSL